MYVNLCYHQKRDKILALAISYDCLYEHICLYSLTDCFSGRKTDRTGIIMEELALTLILILAARYVFRHVKRTLMIGENDKGCQHCPAAKIQSPDKQTQ